MRTSIWDIIRDTNKRKGVLMPTYLPQDVAGYHVDIKPKGKWRFVLNKLHIEPSYFVGDRVSLVFTFTRFKPDAKPLNLIGTLASFYPQNERSDPPYRFTPIPPIENGYVEMDYKSKAEISKDGTAEIYITDKRTLENLGKLQDTPIALFSTGVRHKDLILMDVVLVLFGGVLGGVIAIVVQLILAHCFGIGGGQ